MSEDAQAEAERIVMAAVEATPDDPYPHEDRLVAALAAAIEVAEQHVPVLPGDADGYDLAMGYLIEALSALGVSTTEEPT